MSEGGAAAPDEPADAADQPVVVPGPPTWWGGTTRVRGEAPADPAPPAVGAGPSTDLAVGLPIPGRHASRRAGEPLRERLVGWVVPETLRGRLTLSPGALTTVALVLALGLGLTCWFLVRSRPSAVPVPAPSPVGASVPGEVLPSGGPASGAADAVVGLPTASTTPAQVTVDVAGRVRRPGIAVLPAGSRVVDAVAAAGGARAGVDLTTLNLARVLVDGEQILVGVRGASAAAPAPAVGASGDSGAAAVPGPDRLVDLNTADAAALEALPEVGPVTAQAIIAYRTEHGGFAAVDELLDVDGIGEATLAQIRPWVTV